MDIEKLVGANITGIEDKILGYMVIFSVSDKMHIDASYFQSLLKEYGYDRFVENPTPQKAFKRAMQVFKKLKEEREIKIKNSIVKVEVIYDTVESGDSEYLIRKIKVTDKKKRKFGEVDTERLAKIYLKKGKIKVEAITRHIDSIKKALTEKEVEKVRKIIEPVYKEYLNTYDGVIIRSFIRDKILRELCSAIPFVGRGGAWFIMNREDVIRNATNLKEIVSKVKSKAYGGKISILFIPLFDGEDIREKIKEDIGREITARYKKLLNRILQRLIYAKSGDKIEEILNELTQDEDAIVKMLKEYADLIKGSIKIEIENLEGLKRKAIETIKEKGIGDIEKAELLIESLANYKDEDSGIEVVEKEEVEKEEGLISDERLSMLAERLVRT